MDQDLDDRISLDELIGYCKQRDCGIETTTIIDMFNDATKLRRVTNPKQYSDPLSIQEIQ
jgi:hypothetical protein